MTKTLTLIGVLISPHPCEGWGGLEQDIEHCNTHEWEQIIKPRTCAGLSLPEVYWCETRRRQ